MTNALFGLTRWVRRVETLMHVVVGLVSAYLSLQTVAAWFAIAKGRHRTTIGSVPRTDFSIVVPAHNEERLIAATIERLYAVDYPKTRYQVHVVADHCSDRTAALARAAGAVVHENIDSKRSGKGPALSWAIDRIATGDNPPDIVLIIDADTHVSPDVLHILDARMRDGAEVVQTHYAVLGPELSHVTAFRAAALAVRHYLRPLGRTALGSTSGLFGNGMAVRTDLLLAHAWTDHLTEDVEFQVELVLRGIKVDFAADARIEAEMPDTLEAARSQHERWEGGRIDLAGAYVPRLLRTAISRDSKSRWAQIDTAIDLIVPPFSVLFVGTVANAAVTMLVSGRGRRGALLRRFSVATLLVQVVHVMSGLVMVRSDTAVYRSLLQTPAMVMWKVRMWLRMLNPSRDVAWVRTARNESVG